MRIEEIPNRSSGHREASAAATAALGMLDYPVSKDEAIDKVGDWQIPIDKETTLPLADILQEMPEERFNDVADALNAVDKHWGDAVPQQ